MEYADVFEGRGGFDLILGNPPWVRVEWKEAGVLGDRTPLYILRKLSAAELSKRRQQALSARGMESEFLQAHEEAAGLQAFLSSRGNYSDLEGLKVNLYKALIANSWRILTPSGVAGLLHPDSLYDDPKGGPVRRVAFGRLRRHFQFTNEMSLFSEIHNQTKFAINIYGPPRNSPRFLTIANLFVPSTIDACESRGSTDNVPGIKDDDDRWDVSGHPSRVVHVGVEELKLFAQLYDEPGTPYIEARLPAVHSVELMQSLLLLAKSAVTLGTFDKPYKPTKMWHETNAVREGLIIRNTDFAASAKGWVVSGPHFSLGNLFFKCPRREVLSNKSYDVIDLEDLPPDYLPRTIYQPGVAVELYRARAPRSTWDADVSVLDCYRVVVNRMVGSTSERTLQPAIAPRELGHVHTVYSYSFANDRYALLLCGSWMSLPVDFLLKVSGTSEFSPNWAKRLPFVVGTIFDEAIVARVCVLVCLTEHFADLWARHSNASWTAEKTLFLAKIAPDIFASAGLPWGARSAVRSSLVRRALLVEVDVLVSMALGLSLQQLLTIYRIQFPVHHAYELDTWYDQKGRIIFTNSRGLTGVGLPRSKSAAYPTGPYWSDVSHLSEGAGYTGSETITQIVTDDTLPGGPRKKTITYQAPWFRCNREHDYEAVWKHFEERFGKEGKGS